MPLSDKQIAIIGAGNMGGALLSGLIDSGVVKPANVVVHNKRAERTRDIAQRFSVLAAESNVAAVKGADVVLIGVKPQVMPSVLEDIAPELGHALVLSVAAGIRTSTIEAALGEGTRVVRGMPNTPALIKEAATAIAAGANATDEDMDLSREILSAVGTVVVVDEAQLDAVTGLSGSGPAYVFVIIEALTDAGVRVGLPRATAQALAIQTLRGAAGLAQQTGEHPAKLKDMVTSPGGTAIAGLHALEAGGVRAGLIDAVRAATERARELGQS